MPAVLPGIMSPYHRKHQRQPAELGAVHAYQVLQVLHERQSELNLFWYMQAEKERGRAAIRNRGKVTVGEDEDAQVNR